ncbi:nicotinate-nucleotide--dimethylbenzimidazole phosphoribosyltransferase [Croceicoccus sp. F390]|uniref:Nicotinate-nucleotide--dimethylbenzimidazole phosphoribosyltransferase n=1 Tax=Croceicoccus esteveae TaxID=3075597 RepID=A0ABU2ZKG1_9SPHN|nr:nicotinate-nucleotide--dimethylbenzimidazole phosphoribosyltransferase [Croceicoccus sp. F390]MDT0577093.1 nicotinate-nucleotide--dimethylbenzimidazole phosphoribosyltransferase [Croceicoccus sp. F390]
MNSRTFQQLLDQKTKPIGSLGGLEELAVRVASVTNDTRPGTLSASLTIFAADHGIAEEGVSAFPQEVTGQMVSNFLAEGAAANAIAGELGIPVAVVDCGVKDVLVSREDLINMRLGAGTANSAQGPAMSQEVAAKAISQGQSYGRSLTSKIVCFGEMGIANTSSATLLANKLSGILIADLIGRGTGVDDAGLKHKKSVLERAAARTGRLAPIDALAEVGGFEIGTMAGAMIGACASNKVVVVDGFIATAASALARALAPGCEASMIYAHRSAEQGHTAMLEWLKAKPLLDLQMRLGEGTGALLAVPIIRASVSLFGMASFTDARVSGRSADK